MHKIGFTSVDCIVYTLCRKHCKSHRRKGTSTTRKCDCIKLMTNVTTSRALLCWKLESSFFFSAAPSAILRGKGEQQSPSWIEFGQFFPVQCCYSRLEGMKSSASNEKINFRFCRSVSFPGSCPPRWRRWTLQAVYAIWRDGNRDGLSHSVVTFERSFVNFHSLVLLHWVYVLGVTASIILQRYQTSKDHSQLYILRFKEFNLQLPSIPLHHAHRFKTIPIAITSEGT